MNSHGSVPAIIFGTVIIGVVLLDAFETVVLPRRVTRHFKLTAWFYRRTWIPWRKIAARIQNVSRQQSFLGYFGPLPESSTTAARRFLRWAMAISFQPRRARAFCLYAKREWDSRFSAS